MDSTDLKEEMGSPVNNDTSWLGGVEDELDESA